MSRCLCPLPSLLFSSYDVVALLVSWFVHGSTHALGLVCSLNHFDLSYAYRRHHVLPHPATSYPIRRLLHFLHHELGEVVGPLHPILQAATLLLGRTILSAIG